MWIMNAYMGGNPSKYHFVHPRENSKFDAYVTEHFWMNDDASVSKKTSAPLIVSKDVKERLYGLNGAIGKHRTFETYRMTLGAFSELLRSYLRWGYTVGKSDIFKFHFFLFVNNDLQKSTNTSTDGEEAIRLRFLNCQASVALSALWWMQAAGQVVGADANERQNIDVIAKELSPLVFPRVTYKHNLKGVPLRKWRKAVKLESQKQLNEFMQGAAVRQALSTEFNEAKNTSKSISAKLSSQQNLGTEIVCADGEKKIQHHTRQPIQPNAAMMIQPCTLNAIAA